jgi:hypothetical protein
MMRNLLFGALVAVGMCGQPRPFDPEIDVPLGEPFPLRVGQSAEVMGTPLRLRFEAVPEDSRCPADAVCVWQGNARVSLHVEIDGEEPEPLLLNTGIDPRTARADGYVVALESVQPAIYSDRTIDQEDYVITLRVREEN